MGHLEKSRNVLPYFCDSESSTVISSFKFIGVRRLWVYSSRSSFGVSSTSNFLLVRYQTCVMRRYHAFLQEFISIFCLSNELSGVSLQSKCSRVVVRDFLSSNGLRSPVFVILLVQ